MSSDDDIFFSNLLLQYIMVLRANLKTFAAQSQTCNKLQSAGRSKISKVYDKALHIASSGYPSKIFY